MPLVSNEHSEPCQTSKMVLLVKIVNMWNSLIIFIKSSPLDIWQSSECVSGHNLVFTKFYDQKIPEYFTVLLWHVQVNVAKNNSLEVEGFEIWNVIQSRFKSRLFGLHVFFAIFKK